MTAARLGASVTAVHLRVTYFSPIPEPQHGKQPLLPEDVARVFRQLTLLVEYAKFAWSPAELEPITEVEIKVLAAVQVGVENISERFSITDDRAKEHLSSAIAKLDAMHVASEPAPVEVVLVQMASPLNVVLEIPPAAWVPLGLGLVLLAEQIATMPVRIARKRKEELLKLALADRQIKSLLAENRLESLEERAKVLGRLLLNEGPSADARGPSEVAFVDPDDPQDELEVSRRRSTN